MILENFYEVEIILRNVYEIREKLISKNHPDTADVLNYLGYSWIDFGKNLDFHFLANIVGTKKGVANILKSKGSLVKILVVMN